MLKIRPFLVLIHNESLNSAIALMQQRIDALDMSYMSDLSKKDISNLKSEITSLQSSMNSELAATNWKIPDVGMEFVWITALNCWVGKYEVTNEEYRKYKRTRNKNEFDDSLKGDRLPVIYVNYDDATEYAKWLTKREQKAGRLPTGGCYRLPTEKEWTTFSKCGDNRKYPWGDDMPPKYGNYSGQESMLKGALTGKISGYDDGFPELCPVEESGKNDWGLYGVGGNAWECTVKSETNLSFDAWRGASWIDFEPEVLRCSSRDADRASSRDSISGFRLVLAR